MCTTLNTLPTHLPITFDGVVKEVVFVCVQVVWGIYEWKKVYAQLRGLFSGECECALAWLLYYNADLHIARNDVVHQGAVGGWHHRGSP